MSAGAAGRAPCRTRPRPPRPDHVVAADFEVAPPPLQASRNAPVTVRAPRRFDLVGARWASDGRPPPGLRLRARRAGGRWSAWFHLAPGDGGARSSDPLWTGG